MEIPEYIGDVTQHAFDGFEEHCTYDKMLSFLSDPQNFMTVPKGIKRDLLECLNIEGSDEEIIEEFKRIIKVYSFTTPEMRKFDEQVHGWFYENKLPRRDWAVRLCFVFQLNDEQAGHFLWKVCKLNGFCYRSAEDIIYCYCLANGKSYQDAKALIADYKNSDKNTNFPSVKAYKELVISRIQTGIEDFTETTDKLRIAFRNLKGMDEKSFKNKLFSHSKYFIDYGISAHKGIVAQFYAVRQQMKMEPLDDMDEEDDQKSDLTYELVWRKLAETSELIGEAQKPETRPLMPINAITSHIQILVNSLPSVKKIRTIMKHSRPEAATDRKGNSARMLFVFLYFAQYVLRWERYLFDVIENDEKPEEFFSDFYEGLNNQLENCGYGYLYYANPFDWHILSCIRLLDNFFSDEDSEDDDMFGALAQFNKALAQVAE